MPYGGNRNYRQFAQPQNNGNEQGNQNNDNRNLNGQQNHTTPKKLLKTREAKIPTKEILMDYLRKAKGDKDKARRQATADGYDISKR